jgi:hypothetical protein
MLAPIIDVHRLSAEIFADLGQLLNHFRTSQLTYWNLVTKREQRNRKRLNSLTSSYLDISVLSMGPGKFPQRKTLNLGL